MEEGDQIDVLLQQRGGSCRFGISLDNVASEETVAPDSRVDGADEAPAELDVHMLCCNSAGEKQVDASDVEVMEKVLEGSSMEGDHQADSEGEDGARLNDEGYQQVILLFYFSHFTLKPLI